MIETCVLNKKSCLCQRNRTKGKLSKLYQSNLITNSSSVFFLYSNQKHFSTPNFWRKFSSKQKQKQNKITFNCLRFLQWVETNPTAYLCGDQKYNCFCFVHTVLFETFPQEFGRESGLQILNLIISFAFDFIYTES